MAQSGRRLTARPMESEQPEAEINYNRRATMYTKTAFFYNRIPVNVPIHKRIPKAI
jgi:hypothetical protein